MSEMSLQYLGAAVFAFGAVSVLGTVLRAMLAGRPSLAGAPDYGLLRPLAELDTFDTGCSVRNMLRGSGVRSTLVRGYDGRTRVLVFADEYDRAQRLVSWAL
jgi:hypothetical protein